MRECRRRTAGMAAATRRGISLTPQPAQRAARPPPYRHLELQIKCAAELALPCRGCLIRGNALWI